MSTSRIRSTGNRYSFTTQVNWTLTECRRWLISPNVYGYEERTSPGSAAISNVTYHDDRQTIQDIIGAIGMYNSCTHTKYFGLPMGGTAKGVSLRGSPRGGTYTWGWAPIGYTGVVLSPASMFSMQNTFANYSTGLTLPSFSDVDWATLVDQVGSQLDGRMTASQNMLVSLAQITQTVGMIKNPFGMRQLAKVGGNKMSLGAILKKPAGAYLEYKFGWENLYRDYLAIAKVWSEVRAHKEYLEESVNRYVPVTARSTVTYSTPQTLGTITPSPTQVRMSYTGYRTNVRKVGCFSLNLRRTEAMNSWSTIDQILARLGVNDLATALWDLVPYSFVVDWFTHINRVLERSPISWNSYDIRRMGYSRKTEWDGRVVGNHTTTISSPACPYTYKSESVEYGPGIVQTKYERFPGFPPNTSSVGLFGNLTKTQMAEGIALIIQRL